MTKHFKDFDFTTFWSNSEYAKQKYQLEPIDKEAIGEAKQESGYKLPQSYIEFMTVRNGGIPEKRYFTTHDEGEPIEISGFFGISISQDNSIYIGDGIDFWVEEWGYPAFGIYICDTPSAGHELILLDYRSCGKEGEPKVVHVDQENDFKIMVLAENFETFIRGLHI